jgi:hypothetical protein
VLANTPRQRREEMTPKKPKKKKKQKQKESKKKKVGSTLTRVKLLYKNNYNGGQR